MSKINCSVNNCTHNKSNICYASIIDVCGGNADVSDETSCASFLNKLNYSPLTNMTYNDDDPCSNITCGVDSCFYNDNKFCSADRINVSGNKARIYEETDCDTFRNK